MAAYLKYELLYPGFLRQEVKHREAGVGSHSRHGHPVSTRRTASNVVRKSWEVVYKRIHSSFIETRHMNSEENKVNIQHMNMSSDTSIHQINKSADVF